MVIGLALMAGISAEAQWTQPPVFWNFINGGLATNVVGSTAQAGYTNTTLLPLTNISFGGITNIKVLATFSCTTNIGGVSQFGSNAIFQLQGSADYAYWNNLGPGWATNATWFSDPLLVLAVPITATNVLANTNYLGIVTNGTSGQSNFNVSLYTAIRPGPIGNQLTNIAMTNITLELYWR